MTRMSTIGLHPFDPSFKSQYNENDRVEFLIDGNQDELLTGTVRGLSHSILINWWIIQLDKPIPGWQYSCVTVQHTFMRLQGSNEPFPTGIAK